MSILLFWVVLFCFNFYLDSFFFFLREGRRVVRRAVCPSIFFCYGILNSPCLLLSSSFNAQFHRMLITSLQPSSLPHRGHLRMVSLLPHSPWSPILPLYVAALSPLQCVSSLRESPPALAVALEPVRDSTSFILHSSPNWTCSHKGLQKGSDHGSLALDVYFPFPGIFNFGGFLSSSYIEGISLFFWFFFLFGFWLLFCVLEDILGRSGLL